ncbi:hypothetical protein [Marinoscillum sp. MHG1-6]|uniref:hypothetical protein n=1 Tax=Marinoscillum sp. MHG1-6 TaxID=2959627 RepID=UPI0021584A9F|nr:hypothetical protein [Marinoscillum sp. MHG1-6]
MRYVITMVLTVFSVIVWAQGLDVILKGHFEDYGQEYWDQIKTVVVNGEWVNEEFEKYPINLTYKRPEKIRLEGEWNQKTFLEVSNGALAWGRSPWKNQVEIQYLEPEEHLIIDNLFDLGSPLTDFKDSLMLLGLELYEGELMIRLQCQDGNLQRDFYLDKENYRLRWEVIISKVGRKTMQMRKQYEKYKHYHGLLSPTSVRVYYESGQRELVFHRMALGVGASDSLFEMPQRQ